MEVSSNVRCSTRLTVSRRMCRVDTGAGRQEEAVVAPSPPPPVLPA